MSGLIALGLSAIMFVDSASSLIATDVIRAGDRVTIDNAATESGQLSDEERALLGREVRRTVYAGQPIRPENTQSPRLVTRNQTVTVKYVKGALEITLKGRAMSEAGQGEAVSVMNLQSRQIINGIVTAEGWILAQ